MTNQGNLPPVPPPGVPPQPQGWGRPPVPGYPLPPREGRSTSFFVAIFLGLLLLVSGGLNVLLFVVSLGSFATSGMSSMGSADDEGVGYEKSHVSGAHNGSIKVLRIAIEGAIAESGSPVIGAAGGTVSHVRAALRLAEKETDIRGILLAIDSPGGGVTDSDEIYRMLVRFKAAHPQTRVLALFGDMAASGGYYVAVAADRIMARRTSITGSIGVIMSAWNFAEAAKKFGVEQVAIKSDHTPLKDILSPTRPMTEPEHALLQGVVEELYQQFVSVVDEGRTNLDRQQVIALATGAIYTANQALQNGLIDEVGDGEDALAWFKNQFGNDTEIVEYRRRPGLRELLFGAAANRPATAADAAAFLLHASTGPRFLYWWPGAR